MKTCRKGLHQKPEKGACALCKKACMKIWRAKNRARLDAYNLENFKNWYKERWKSLSSAERQSKNRKYKTSDIGIVKTRELANKRRAGKLQATPAWANNFFIKEVYHLARLREKVCGGKWHVDHIVPLKSKLVCGLHWEQNLQVIPAIANISKGNRSWPGMPE